MTCKSGHTTVCTIILYHNAYAKKKILVADMNRNPPCCYLLQQKSLDTKIYLFATDFFLPIDYAIPQGKKKKKEKNKETVPKSLHSCHVSPATSKSVGVLNMESLQPLLNFKMLNQCYFHIGLA